MVLAVATAFAESEAKPKFELQVERDCLCDSNGGAAAKGYQAVGLLGPGGGLCCVGDFLGNVRSRFVESSSEARSERRSGGVEQCGPARCGGR